MIKVLSNTSYLNKTNIKVYGYTISESLGSYVSNSIIYPDSKGCIYIQVSATGLKENDKISNAKLNFVCHGVLDTLPVKVLKLSYSNLDYNTLTYLKNNYSGEGEVIDYVSVPLSGYSVNSGSDIGDYNITVDLTKAFEGLVGTTRTAIFAINLSLEDNIIVENPQYDGNCVFTICDMDGYNPLYKYDEHNFGGCGKSLVNLCTGQQIYELPLFTSLDKRVPLSFSLFHNVNKNDSVIHFNHKLVPNFFYKIYLTDNLYTIEDPTGFSKYYSEISKEGLEYSNYNIKHTNESGRLFYCYLDNSYFYLADDGVVITLYDKFDNKIVFNVDSSVAKIDKITKTTGEIITYTWNGFKLVKISNGEEEILVSYDSNGYIKTVSIPNMSLYANFTETLDTTQIQVYSNEGDSSTPTLLKDVSLIFENNVLYEVKDNNSNNFIRSTYDTATNKVINSGIYNSEENSFYVKNYTYDTDYTQVTDSDNNKLFYFFDTFGRVKTIMDEHARTISYDYDEVEEGVSKNLIGVSKVQTNSRNILENHSFENEDIDFSSVLGWVMSGPASSVAEVVDGGVLGEKCLKVKTFSSEYTTIYQSLLNPNSGTYKLSGYIKHPNLQTTTASGANVLLSATYDVWDFVPVFEDSVEIGMKPEKVTKALEKSITINVDETDWYHFETEQLVIPSDALDISMKVEMKVAGSDNVVFFDDLQVTDGLFDTRYNLIENGYLEFFDDLNLPEGWTFENLQPDEEFEFLESTGIHSKILGNNVMMFKGNINPETNAIISLARKKMYRTLNVKGLSGEKLIYTVFGKGYATRNSIFRAFIKITYDEKPERTHTFSFGKNLNNWQVLTRSITAEDNYSKIVVGVEYVGVNDVYVDCFQLYKDTFGTYYNYDSQGNILEVINSDGSSNKMLYNSDNKLAEVHLSDGSYYCYTYENGLVKSVRDLFGNTVDLKYDNKKRVIGQSITHNGEVYSSTVSYDDSLNSETHTNEFGDSSLTKLDYLDRVSEFTDYNNLLTSYTYNQKLQLEKLQSAVDGVTYRNEFTYDTQGKTKKIASNSGLSYTIEYDLFNRIKSILVGTEKIEKYEYDNNVSVGNAQIVKKTIGDYGDYYEFEYNNKGQIVSFKLNGNNLATYTYDDSGNLHELYDVENNIKYYYEYDLKGNLLQEFSTKDTSISYNYDNLGSIQKVSYNILDVIRTIDYEYPYEMNDYTKEGYFQRLSDAFKDELVIGGQLQYSDKEFYSLFNKHYDDDLKSEVMRFYDYNHKSMYDLSKINQYRKREDWDNYAYYYERWKSFFRNNKTFYAWVKPSAYINNQPYYKTNLFSFNQFSQGSSITNEVLSYLAINDNGKLIYYTPSGQVIAETIETINFNEWNLIGIKFAKIEEQTKIQIILNNEVTSEITVDENIDDINLLAVSNQDNITELAAHLHTTLDFTLIGMSAHAYTNDELSILYKEGIKYLCADNQERYYGSHYYDHNVYSGFDVITLNGSLESANGLKPYKVHKIDDSYRCEKNKIFIYDVESQRFVYGCYINEKSLKLSNSTALSYKLPLEDTGCISLRFKFESSDTEKCILSFKKDSVETFGLYITNTNKLKLVANNSAVTSNIQITPDIWNTVVVSYNPSQLVIYYNELSTYHPTARINLKDTILYVANDEFSINPLNGCVEMLAFKQESITSTEISNIVNNSSPISVKKVVDSIGRVTGNIINVSNSNYTTTYNYDKTRISSETLPDGTVISYTYDKKGNILTKTFSKDEQTKTETYTYNNLGRLTQFIYSINGEEQYKYKYFYNKDGGFTSQKKYINDVLTSNKTFTYQGCRLIKVRDTKQSGTGETINYGDSGLDFYPTSMFIGGVSHNLTWQGKRLVGVGDDISYTYNHQGLRIKKETTDDTITYTFEGSNIISMTKTIYDTTHRLDFTYDAQNQLIGLTTSEGNYFYIRDITNNIIGLIDTNGEYVVKYKYDVWGKLLEKDIITPCIASEHNPFIFKGYYYDEETGLFMVGHRYYNPEWGRWLSPDDIEYLDSQSINGLNLYAYCGNDPVNKYDPTGHFAISIGFLIGSILIGAAVGAGISGVSAYAEGERGWDLVWDIVGGAVFGAAIGATAALGGAAGLGAVAGSAVTGANISMGAALGLSIGGMAFASATKYSLDCAASSREWNLGGYFVEALQGAAQGTATFGLSYLGGKAGLFNKIGNFNSWDAFYTGFGGMNNLKMIGYMSNLIMGPGLSKLLFISGIGAGVRWIIDKMIPEF